MAGSTPAAVAPGPVAPVVGAAASDPAISVIIPTLNRAALLENFLRSCQSSDVQDFEVIVNDDPRSTDATPQMLDRYRALGLDITYLRENLSMAAGRAAAVRAARGRILLHLDSDMELSTTLIGECLDRLAPGIPGALLIPEDSFGPSFWARCKWLEKRCYEGVDRIESLRCLTRSVYDAIGGHDVTMTFSEDKDLDIRVRAAGFTVSRTRSALRHNEGRLTLRATMAKKASYGHTAGRFAEKHPEEYRWSINPLNRYWLFLTHPQYLVEHPLLYVGLFYMKTCEYLASFIGLLHARVSATA